MLVLSRKPGERIVLADIITIQVLEVQGNRVRIGIQAPRGVSIYRQELLLRDEVAAPGREGDEGICGATERPKKTRNQPQTH